MSRIVFQFKGLCVLFTENISQIEKTSPSLTVGLVAVTQKNHKSIQESLAPLLMPQDILGNVGQIPTIINDDRSDYHYPKLAIEEIDSNGVRTSITEELLIQGDLAFDIYPRYSPLRRFEEGVVDDLNLARELAQKGIIADPNPFRPLHVANGLYADFDGEKKPHAKASLCSALVHFKTGVLFSSSPKDTLFGNGNIDGFRLNNDDLPESNKLLNQDALVTIYIDAGLEMEVPEGGKALLYFGNGSPAISFESEKDYLVSITNEALASKIENRNHFLYYYSVFEPQPSHLRTPVIDLEQPGNPNNNPFCTVIEEP